MKYKKYSNRKLRHRMSVPFIYIIIIPLAILDIFLEIYHNICFPLYNIPKINRKDYIKIDRYKLSYLDYIDKINCSYCGYVNGLLKYSTVIAGESEKYWCGIKHKKTKNFVELEHHKDFIEYGDKKAYLKK